MKPRIIYILIALLGLSVSPAYADYIQGHVVQVDQQHGEVLITLCDICTGKDDCPVDPQRDPEHGKEGVRIKVVASWLPRCLREGIMIFARGVFAPDDPTRFEAVEVFPQMKRGGKDKTGVRSRFRHQGRRGQHKGQHGQ